MAARENAEQMMASAEALDEIIEAQPAAIEQLLPPEPDQQTSNVVGVGAGVKWSNGEPTGEPALVVLVSQKLPEDVIPEGDKVPKMIDGVQTDVLAIGIPFAGGGLTTQAGIQTLSVRARPAFGGYSVGHFAITAGTIATGVYDMLPGSSTNPPLHGIGIPRQYYILSNNHVLANSNNANIGDACLQPGPFDGGKEPADRIALLSRFVPITFDPPVNRAFHTNLVDAAVAAVEFHDLNREIYWIGQVRGWRRRADVTVGTYVQKTGRTTNYTTGRITAINATVDVGYGNGRIARFRDQIITTNISAGGDSGSLVTTYDNVAVGLLFAGSSIATIVNQIEHVRSLLRVEVAEEIL